jgi:UDP-N-acetylmuramate: L-alanyl-gamma-D-glutamyl-meso-diaminopimelate ligase
MSLPKGSEIYFVGIGGTGMASVAGLCQEAGYSITGSDAGIYPPMSDMLKELGIKAVSPYSVDNVKSRKIDLAVIANVLSRGNVELEWILENKVPYVSFPALMGDLFLKNRFSCVVAGTHGKTTTSSILAHVLNELDEDPGFLIGGIPRNFPRSFRIGSGKPFVIEGDEYDTAFFDKGPKFLHYCPKLAILNNLEFDHADIYPNLEAIEKQFVKLAKLVPNTKNVIANIDDPGINKILAENNLLAAVTSVSTEGKSKDAKVYVGDISVNASSKSGIQHWKATYHCSDFGQIAIETQLSGRHNIANIAMVLASLQNLVAQSVIRKPDIKVLSKAFASFLNVKRRLDRLAFGGDIEVYEDFAHHPTAVKLVIEGFKQAFPNRRLVVAFEPRSATQRRNVFQNDYARTLALADAVYIGECPEDKRIPEAERMSTAKLQQTIGSKARAFPTNNDLLASLKVDLHAGDSVVFMSSGSFSGVQHSLAQEIGRRG